MSLMEMKTMVEAMVPSLSKITPSLFTLMAMFVGSFLVYLYKPYWGVRDVPGPPLVPLIGHLHLFAKHGSDVFTVLARTYGPVYRFHMGRQPLVIVADPELCREVGIKKFKTFTNRAVPAAMAGSPLHKNSLFSTRDSVWAALRKAIVAVYQPSHLATLIPTMQSFIESAMQDFSLTPGFSFNDFSLKLFTDIIGQAAFGTDFGLSKDNSSINNQSKHHKNDDIDDDNFPDFIEEHVYATNTLKMDLSGSFSIILGLLVPVLQEPFRQIFLRIPGTIDWRRNRINVSLSKKVNAIVEKRASANEGGTKNFLSSILDARDSGRLSSDIFTYDRISGVTYEHLLGGSTSTSFTMSCLVYLVSKHPEVEEKLLREIDEYSPSDRIPNGDDLLLRFPYLNQVIKETLRFYTASPVTAREATQQVEVGGYLLPKGTWVWLAIGALAQDPKNFPEPEAFRPERFDPDCEEEKQRHPYANIPFGLGPRGCPGQNFALQEIRLLVIHLYRNYVFRHSDEMESPLEFDYGIIVDFKNGVKLNAIKRFTS